MNALVKKKIEKQKYTVSATPFFFKEIFYNFRVYLSISI
jgi:hypothetical protein